MSEISQEFTCKCGKTKGWLTENQQTSPCPQCGKKYFGVYSKKKLGLIATEITPEKLFKKIRAYIKSLNNV